MVETNLKDKGAAARGEIVFVDPAIADLNALLRGLRAGVRAFVLDPASDAVQQMADALAGVSGLSAVHIIAHGSPGEIGFSAGPLSLDTIRAHEVDLVRIGEALEPVGELLVWSCDTGRGVRGDRFLEALCWATGALVAAATGTVGAATRGGRWELDARLGAKVIPLPLTPTGMAGYRGLLATKTWKTPGASGNWGTAGAWTPSGVPAAGDDVTIGASATAFTVTLTANTNAVDSLTINSGATLAVVNHTLNVNGTGTGATDTITVASGGTLTIAGGTINATTLADAGTVSGSGTIAAAVSGAGTVTASGGTLSLSGTVSSGPAFTIDTTAAADLKFTGTATAASAITINNANQTLEVGAGGNLTISAAESITNGKIVMSGGTLNDASGVTVGSGATLTGQGTVTANLVGAGTITASGGTLTLSGTVSSGPAFTIATASASDLKFTGTATAAAAITINNANQTLEVGAGGNLTIGAAESITNGTILLSGGALNDASGVTVGSGATLSGKGSVTANLSGSGTITASGGTLTLSGTVSSGPAFTIATASASDLKFTGTAIAAAAITINNANQTLEVGTGGALTIGAAETVSLGKIQMSGGTLTDSSGINIGSGGNSGTLTGFGKVVGNVAKSGTGTTNTVTASGGTLEITGTLTSLNSLTVGSGASDTLLLDGVGSATALTFSGSTGTLELNTSGTLTLTNALAVGANTVKLDGAGTTQLTDTAGITIAGGTISGTGTISSTTAISGSGTIAIPISANSSITASGGTLNLTGTVTSGTFAIATASASVLEFSGTATTGAISITNANQTLQVGGGGHLTITAAETVSLGKIQMSGGTLTDSSGITLGSSTSAGTLTGFGTVSANIGKGGSATTNTITASGGALEITGTVTSIDSLTVGSGASDTLKLDAASTATGLTFSGSTGTLELNTSGTLTLTNALAVGANTVKLDGAGTTQLTDTAGLTIAGGTISGTGTISATTAVTGSGTIAIPISNNSAITASGGTLNLTGTVTSGTFAIATASASVLEFSGTATTGAISITNANQTLQVGAGGNLTIGAAESVTNGTILLSGGTLNDSSGITVGSGATLSGQGNVTANLSGSGTITASGGTLTLSGTVSSGPAFTIATASASDLKFTGTATAASAISISSANQTLEIGASGALTIGAAQTITGGTIKLDGGLLTDASGLTVGTSGTLTGFGTVNPAITGPSSGAGAITASGGTLELKSTVTVGAGTLAYTIGSGSSDRLLLDAGSAATSLAFSGSTGTLELNTSGTLTLTNALSVGANTVKLDGASSQLTDSAGISLSSGTITGLGKVTGAITATGAAGITASGGTLEIASAVTNSGSLALTVGGGASDKLLLDAGSAATSLSFSGSTGTLELNTGGTLTLTNALALGANTVKLDGASSQLTDNAGISLSTGTISGLGKVTGAITATGAASITASGGTLEIASGISNSGNLALIVGSGASDKLLLDGTSAATSLSFSGSTGTLELNTSGTLTLTNALSVGTNTVKLDGAGTTQLTDAAGITLAGGAISGTGLLSSSTNVTGAGTLGIGFTTGSNTIIASGGTLDVTGSVTTSQTLTIANVSGSVLKLDHGGVTVSPITLDSGNKTLEIAQSATISGVETVAGGTLTIDSGATLTDTSGITLSGGTLSGAGSISISTAVSGNGTVSLSVVGRSVTASGGTLDVTGNVDTTSTLAIANVSGSVLKLDHSGVTVSPITLDSGNKTLEIAQSATISGAQTVSGGTLTIDSGATLTDTSGITLSGGSLSGAGLLSSSTNVTGAGTLGIGFTTGSNTITASGGTLDVTGIVTTSQTLAIANVAGSVLKLDHSGVTVSPITLDSGNKTLEIAQSATISGAQTISGGALTIDSGATLTDTSGITLSGGTLSGAGGLAANTNLSGSGSVSIGISNAGTITASGGTLDLTGTISGRTLAIADVANSVLKIDGNTTTGAIALDTGNKTLEIGVSGKSLILTALETMTAGKIQLDGGSLSDSSGFAINGGTLIGHGTVSGGTINGAGTIEASGGTLDLSGASLGAVASGVEIANDGSTLAIDNVASGADVTFLGGSGTLKVLHVADFLGTIGGLAVAANDTTPLNGIDLADIGTITRTQISGNTVTIYNGSTVLKTLNLASAPGAGTHADWISDGSGGQELFLSSVACFCRGTLILTDRGEVPVEELSIGDSAVTLSGIAKPVKWIGRRSYPDGVITDRKVLPIKVAAGALGPALPRRDLYLSPEHALYIDGVLVPAGELVNGRSIVRLESVSRLEYFHIELEDHDVIYADGAASETFVDCDNRAMFANVSEFSALYPADARPAWRFCAPRVERGSDELNGIRSMLQARAEALGYQLTDDPDLHLIVDGEIVRPQTIAKNVHRFAIPAGAASIWLASRSAVPAEVAATSQDRRRLGVSIAQISLRDDHISFEVDHTYPDFCEGFHGAERGHRWTNGRARLPDALLKPFLGDLTMEVRIYRSPIGYPKDPSAQRPPVAA